MMAKSGTLPHPAKKAPILTRNEEKGEITVEVDKTKAKQPYRFLSYSTARKVGIAQTTFGGALLSMNSLTMQPETLFIEMYIFFIPGLLVIFGGSFAIRATKVKRRRIRASLMILSVVFSLLGMLAALAVEVRACLLLLQMTKLNIMLILLQVVALGVLPVSILQIIISLDSVFCGKHRLGYSMTLKVVYKVAKTGDSETQVQAGTEGEDTVKPNHGNRGKTAATDESVAMREEILDVQQLETLPIRDR